MSDLGTASSPVPTDGSRDDGLRDSDAGEDGGGAVVGGQAIGAGVSPSSTARDRSSVVTMDWYDNLEGIKRML